MIVLDTNILSALMRKPERRLIRWLDAQPRHSLWTTSITIFEIQYGLQSLPKGRRRTALQREFELAVKDDLENRVLDFDTPAAREAANLSARLRHLGRPVEIRDVMIAGVVASRRALLATRNTKHFVHAEIPLVDPGAADID